MKFAFPLLLALLLVGCASRAPQKKSADSHTGQRTTVRTTAYTSAERGGANNAVGSRLHYGAGDFSAASDWSWMPLGTRFRVVESGRCYVIEDYGSALVGRQTIDLFVPSMSEVRKWGVRQIDIEILEWGSKAMSLKLLEPRSRNAHVALMVAELRKAVPPAPRS